MPIFAHDCGNCRHLGSLNKRDFYVCTHGDVKELVIRNSSDGWNYSAMEVELLKKIRTPQIVAKYALAAELAGIRL